MTAAIADRTLSDAQPALSLADAATAVFAAQASTDSADFSVAGNGFFAVYVGLFLSFALVGKVHLSPARDDPPAVISAA